MATFKQVIVDALEKKHEAKMAEAEANIKVYMENPVGVGEHPNVVEDICRAPAIIKESKEMLDELANWRT